MISLWLWYNLLSLWLLSGTVPLARDWGFLHEFDWCYVYLRSIWGNGTSLMTFLVDWGIHNIILLFCWCDEGIILIHLIDFQKLALATITINMVPSFNFDVEMGVVCNRVNHTIVVLSLCFELPKSTSHVFWATLLNTAWCLISWDSNLVIWFWFFDYLSKIGNLLENLRRRGQQTILLWAINRYLTL